MLLYIMLHGFGKPQTTYTTSSDKHLELEMTATHHFFVTLILHSLRSLVENL